MNRPAGRNASRPRLAIAVGLLLMIAPAVWGCLPLQMQPQQRVLRDAAAEVRRQGWNDRPLIAFNDWVYYWTDRWLPQGRRDWHRWLETAVPGTVFVWDARFCLDPDFGLPLTDVYANAHWRPRWSGPAADSEGEPLAVIFERADALR